ncbi:MAG: hypothetical protein CMA54_00435 [Euryarchaeota archaeon]|jgi:hypothetical protein|nr:hypothetical protein [Euryarchaeota archaeon]MBV43237.1 hypothetical protein [Euryarchaeota archaeon]|tara:strand:+ start:475 stop:963 length:489 start_codon:yes stop_codon:yes gene_type:complete
MEQMGFAVCCLACDAPDAAGSERCRFCIDGHSRSRDHLTSGKATSKAQRLARELITMLVDPANHIDDDAHGDWMVRYLALVNEHQGVAKAKTHKEVVARFEAERKKRKRSIIRDVANQNKWLDQPPDASEREDLLSAFGADPEHRPKTWEELLEEIEGLLDD